MTTTAQTDAAFQARVKDLTLNLFELALLGVIIANDKCTLMADRAHHVRDAMDWAATAAEAKARREQRP